MDNLHINARFEGLTKYTAIVDGEASELEVETVVLFDCGLTAWHEEPYRAMMITTVLNPENDEFSSEARFSTPEQLSTWIEQQISELRRKGFTLVRYKANGMNIDWLAGVNLPS